MLHRATYTPTRAIEFCASGSPRGGNDQLKARAAG